MKKTIIAIYAPAKKGKTSTIKEIYQFFKKDKLTTIIEEEIKKVEVYALFEYGGIKIGIASSGDFGGIVDKNLKKLTDYKCDIIICATRSKGSTISKVWEYAGSEYDTIWFSTLQSSEDRYDKLNYKLAELIYSIAKDIANGKY